MAFTTWVRVEDAFGQFDHPKGADLPAGVSLVEDYREHVGPVAREPKAFTDKTGSPVSRDAKNYDRQNKPAIQAEVKKRLDAGRVLAVDPAKDNKDDLVAALQLDDAAQLTEIDDTTDTSGVPAGSEN